MACQNKDYNASKEFGLVSSVIKTNPNWQTWIINRYKPEIAQEIIALVQNGTFSEDYGRDVARRTRIRRDSLTNEVDTNELKHRYATSFGRVDKIGFSSMLFEFRRSLIGRVLIDPETQSMINGEDISPSGYSYVNQNLFDFKMDLIEDLWKTLFPDKTLNKEYTGSDEDFTNLILDTLYEYERLYLFKPEDLESKWDSYFQLKYFDQLLESFSDFIKLKPEWNNNWKRGMDMYTYIGPYVKYDTSFNPNEFASAEQYASAYTQAILDYFKRVELNGQESKEAITFEGFNRAICDLKEYVLGQQSRALRLQLYKGDDTNWDLLINSYCRTSNARPETVRILKGIQNLLGKDSILDNKIKQVLQQQANRIIRYEFVGYRKGYDPILKRNVITEIRLKDSKIDTLKTTIAKSIRYRVWKSRKQPDQYKKLKATLGIRVDENDKAIYLDGYAKDGYTLMLSPIKNELYTFNWKLVDKNGQVFELNQDFLKESEIKNLIEQLFQTTIPEKYIEVLGTETFPVTTLFGVFSDAIGLTLSASEMDLFDFTFRLNGNELELPGIYFRSLERPAIFLGLINGILDENHSRNGLGNDLPNYQTISAIHQAQEMLDLAAANTDGFRRSIHSATGELHTIHEKSVLNPKRDQGPILGRSMVRADYDADGKNRNSAQMSFRELNYFEIYKSFYANLKKSGNILLQPTCLSDKHVHWLIEYHTRNLVFKNGRTCASVLTDLTSGNSSLRQAAEKIIVGEIKDQRAHATRVEIINLLNRYQYGLGLKLTDFNANYQTILVDIQALHNEFAKFKNTEEIFELLRVKEVDFCPEADLINLDGKIFLNETLLLNTRLYLDPDETLLQSHFQRTMMLHAKNLFVNHFKLDAIIDPALHGYINLLKSELVPEGQETSPEFEAWYDATTQTLKAFRIFDLEGNEIIPTYSQKGLSYFDSTKYRVELNPMLLSHYYANALLSKEFNNIVFGEDYALECKYFKKHKKAINSVKNYIGINEKSLENNTAAYNAAIERSRSTELSKEERKQAREDAATALANINKAKNQLEQLNQRYNKLIDPFDLDFAYKAFASRLAMHYKRTVHGGATYTPLNQNMPYGVSSKVKVAVINDRIINLYSIGGHREGFTSQDGAGHTSPYFSRMCNESYVDGAVGPNKKTIFSYVDPETGMLYLIKWAEYEVTNSIRRDSPSDFEHASYETMFRKMHSFEIRPNKFFDFDISEYYNLEEFTQKTHKDELFFSSPDGLQHFKILSIENNGNLFTRTIIEVDENGDPLLTAVPKREEPVRINTIYDLDQIFGGAYTEEKQENGKLDYSEIQNDIVWRIICDLGLKEDFIGVAINASALKSGQRNNNAEDIFIGNNPSKLSYFEMSTRFGGALMNADHILGETTVTEMSQMISALVQAGKRIGQVNKIYEFIGQIAKESLGDLVDITDDPDREDEVYRWLGDAVVRAFESGSTDTLGLAGAFIARAKKKLSINGLKTKIPFSANTVKSIFESSLASYINREAIHRKFPGGGFVQLPTFDEKLRYTFGGGNYGYTELVGILTKDPAFRNSGMTLNEVFTDYHSLTDDGKHFKNPYIKELEFIDSAGYRHVDREAVRNIDQDDTVVLYDLNEFGEIIPDSIELVRLDEYERYDDVRNFTFKHVALWTVRPKNLLGARTSFKVNVILRDAYGNPQYEVRTYSLYDLDHARALQYAKMLLEKEKLSADAINFLTIYAKNQITGSEIFDLNSEASVKRLRLWAARKLNEDLKTISENGNIGYQQAFRDADPLEQHQVVSHEYRGSQTLIGKKDAERFGIFNRTDLLRAQRDPDKFFKESLKNLRSKPKQSSVPKYAYDGAIHDTEGNTVLLVVDELNGDHNILSGTTRNADYSIDGKGNIYKGQDNLGYYSGIEFLTYKGVDGQEYTVLHANTMNDFFTFYNKSRLYSNWVPNANNQNWKGLAQYVRSAKVLDYGDVIYFVEAEDGSTQVRNVNGPEDLNALVIKDLQKDINILAKKRAASWKAYQKGIGTRIPAQSMQSFTPCEIVGFTDYSTTGMHISAKLMWIQGSDLDIDKLYFMMYGFTEDGMLATFSDLENEMDPEQVLDLPKPNKRNFEIRIGTEDEVAQAVQEGYTFIRGNGFELLQNILDQDNLKVVVLADDLISAKWNNILFNKLEDTNLVDLKRLLDIHENSERSGSIKQLALRNTVVRRIWNVLSDPINQYNLELPISMDSARAAAESSRAGKDEEFLNPDVPSDKYKMQVANVVGREDIGIGASSLKAFFGASTYFNTLIDSVIEEIDTARLNGEPINADSIWHKIRNCMFDSKFTEGNVITYANINFADLKEYLTELGGLSITVSDLGLKTGVNGNIAGLKDVIKGNTIDLLGLVTKLDEISNGKWDAQIDAASSLSEFISIATDNAKELILAKINATTKFADIYTYLISIGESFKSIADFMTSPIFYIVADYIDNDAIESESGLFDLERVVQFVLNEKTLPRVDDGLWSKIITSFNALGLADSGFINMLLYDKTSLGQEFEDKITEALDITINGREGLKAHIVTALQDDDQKQEIINIISNLLERTDAQQLLSKYLKIKVATTASSFDYSKYQEQYSEDFEYEDAIQEEEDAHYYDTGLADMTKEDWVKYYKYLHEVVIPKSQAMQDVTEEAKESLRRLEKFILPALKEQRILAKILGINQGLETKDFDEYKWIRDIEAFVNERYINSDLPANPDLEFNLVKFIQDETYRQKQIDFYDKVKSTYNILDVIMTVPHFREMFKLVRVNRKNLERAVIFKYERVLADKLLKINKKLSANGLSLGLTQKFNEREYRILQSATSDIITRSWFVQLDGLRMNIPPDSDIHEYVNGELSENPTAKKYIDVNTADGLATFKWIVENYIVPKLKAKYRGKDENEFINGLQSVYAKNASGTDVVEYITLPFGLVNSTKNLELERQLLMYRNGFNTIYKDSLEDIGMPGWTVGDVFYLYNLYVFKDGFSRDSMTRIFEDMIVADDNDSTLASEYLNYLLKLDSKIESILEMDRIAELNDEDLSKLNEANSTIDPNATNILNDIRMLLAYQPYASSKFRVRIEKIGDTDVVQMLNQSYGIASGWIGIPVNKLSRSDYKFLLTSWNPIVVKSANISDAVKRRQDEKRWYKVNGQEALRAVVRTIHSRFGSNIPIQLVTRNFLETEGASWNIDPTARGFIRNGMIYVVEDAPGVKVSTPIHELMHVWCAALKYGDAEQKKMYYDLLRAVDKMSNDSSQPYVYKYFSQLKQQYGQYAVGSDLQEEMLVAMLEGAFAGRYYELLKRGPSKINANSQKKETFNQFEKLITKAINDIFDTNSDLLGRKILNMSVGELIDQFATDLIFVNENALLKTYIPLNQQLANFKRRLVKNDRTMYQQGIDYRAGTRSEIPEDLDYLSIIGDC